MATVLIIEDNQDIRENTVEILELEGHTAIIAVNGRDGIQAATQSSPDIILCDIMMPEGNGYDVISILKNNPETAHIPFIYLTARGEKNEIEQAMDLGAIGFIRKPFHVKELMDTINRALRVSGRSI